jgi:hypothetical protein
VKLSCGFGFGNLKQIDFLQLARLKGGIGQSPASTTAIWAHLNLTVRKETTHHQLDTTLEASSYREGRLK